MAGASVRRSVTHASAIDVDRVPPIYSPAGNYRLQLPVSTTCHVTNRSL